MAKAQYIGVSGVARKIKKEYIGVSGVARKVTKGYIGVAGVARQYFSGETPISSVAVGGTVKVAENGIPVDYIVVQIGTPNSTAYANCDGYWLLRKTLDRDGYFAYNGDGDDLADYGSSYADSYVHAAENSYYSRYGSKLKSLILSPSLPYYAGYNAAYAGTITRKVFHLGNYEVNGWRRYNQEDILTYFANASSSGKADTLRIAYDSSGYARGWWLRDASGSGAYRPGLITDAGAIDYISIGGTYYRPCFIVPKTAKLEDLLS